MTSAPPEFRPTTSTVAVETHRAFRVRVAQVTRLSPTFTRVTFTGPDLDQFVDQGFDQRVRLVLPSPAGDLRRRTYTVRAVHPHRREVDIDIALHGAAGLTSRWAATAATGDEAVLVGPDRAEPGHHGGVDWRPPSGVRLLLAGDETAVPAILAILESLPQAAQGEALLEVPDPADAQVGHVAPPGVRVRWLPRQGGRHGSQLTPALDTAVLRLRRRPFIGSGQGAPLEPVDVDGDLLWEVPGTSERGTADGIYVWLAAEAGVVAGLRRRLLVGHGLDRQSVALMGYWRIGRSDPG